MDFPSGTPAETGSRTSILHYFTYSFFRQKNRAKNKFDPECIFVAVFPLHAAPDMLLKATCLPH